MDKINVIIDGVNVELEKESVSKAIETGELKIESDKIIAKSDDLVIYKADEFESYKTNLANDEYKKGKTAGEEMTIKEGREKFGLEFEGKKLDNFAEAFKAKVISEANIKPNEQITELKADKEKLQNNYTLLETEYNTFKSGVTEKQERADKDAKLASFIPGEGLKVNQKLTILALKDAGIDIGYDDNKVPVILENGQIKKDEKTLNPIAPDVYVKEKISALGLFETKKNGSNGSDEPGGGTATSYDLFVKEMAQQNINPGSLKFGEEMAKRQKEKTLVI